MIASFVFGLVLLSFLLSTLIKSAFNSINLLQLELDKQQESYYSKVLLWISKNPISIGISVSIFYYFSISLLFLLIGNSLFSDNNQTIYVAIIISLLVPFIAFFFRFLGETLSNKVINLFAIVILLLYIFTLPFVFIGQLLSNNKTRSKSNFLQKSNPFNKDNLSSLVLERADNKVDEDGNSELKLFRNALEFSETRLRECMIPRTEIISHEITEPIDLLKQKFIQSGLTKIIVYRDTIDNIIGYIKSKTLFFDKLKLDKTIKTLPLFPESMSASKLLKFFISTGQNIAIVVDEFGGTSGVITIEDILEEIFGEITDEHDSETIYEKQLSETDFVFSGRIEIDYINEKYNINIPENEDYETLAGFILYQTENLPNANDIVRFEQFTFQILKVTETRLNLIKLEIQSN